MPTPIDPDPRIRSHKKAPPILIKFNNSNTISNYTTDSFLNARSVNKNYDTKDINAVLPPIKFKTFRKRNIRYLSPVFNFNTKDLKPLFERKKKVDQSLTTKIENSDLEIENQHNQSAYKISVITKTNVKK